MTAVDLTPHAERSASRGYHVFPTRPRTKIPYRTTHGVDDATADIRTVLHLWERYGRDSNIAVAPAPSGAFIFDIDSKGGADPEDVLTELELDLDNLAIVWTGTAGEPDAKHPHSLSGVRGAHVWFRGSAPTGAVSIKGCEIRGAGAYGLLPPSIHPHGDRYEGQLPRAANLPDPPTCILTLVAGVKSTAAAAVEDGAIFTEPGRHERLLNWSRSRYTAHGVLGEAALLGMLKKNEIACRPPLPESEVRRLWAHLERSRIAQSERKVARLIAGWQEQGQ